MTIEEAIIKSGAEPLGDDEKYAPCYKLGKHYLFEDEFLLLPEFWQSLGKALGWDNNQKLYEDFVNHQVEHPFWQHQWHRFIDHLAEGKTVESFFEQLK